MRINKKGNPSFIPLNTNCEGDIQSVKALLANYLAFTRIIRTGGLKTHERRGRWLKHSGKANAREAGAWHPADEDSIAEARYSNRVPGRIRSRFVARHG